MNILLSIIWMFYIGYSKLQVYEVHPHTELIGWLSNQENNKEPISYEPKLNLNTKAQKMFLLPPHKEIFIEITIELTDSFNLSVQVDDQKLKQEAIKQSPNSEITIYYKFIHLNEFAIIEITSQILSNGCSKWAINQITIYVEECEATCKFCPEIYGIDSCSMIQPLFAHAATQLNDINLWKGTYQQDIQFFCSIFNIPLKFQRFYASVIFRNILIPNNSGTLIKFKVFVYNNLNVYNNPNGIKVTINNKIYQVSNEHIVLSCQIQIDSWTTIYNNYYVYHVSISNNDYNDQFKNIQLQIPIYNQYIDISIQDLNIYYQKLSYLFEELQGCQTLLFNKCLECQEGWYFVNDEKLCVPQCGDQTIQGLEECDDGNNEPYDGCYDCNFQCSQNCIVCEFGICLEKMQPKTEIIIIKKECQHIGFISQRGYYFDLQFNDCLPICGDGIVTIDEDCDDVNNIPFDGCFNCKFSCAMNCFNCKFGKCLYCNFGYELQGDRCQPICGDSRVFEQEICDDANDLQFDGCYNCSNSCQIECTVCLNSMCYGCLDGWTLEEGTCQQKCGDGKIAVNSNELCDNVLDIYCNDCLFQCSEKCLKCEAPLQCNLCENTYTLIDGICTSVCGDKQITPDYEQCDDGNDIPFDGCYFCQLQCSYGCVLCQENNTCRQCDNQNYYLNESTAQCYFVDDPINEEVIPIVNEEVLCKDNTIFVDGKCQSLCSNGKLLSLYEDCDDGNLISGDGCSSQCKEEESFICLNTEDQLSICSFIVLPDFNFRSLTQKINQMQIIELYFTEQVKIIQDTFLEDICKFEVLPQTEYEMKIIPITNLTTMLSNAKYQISILFKQPVENPKFSVSFIKQQIYNSNDAELKTLEKTVSLGTPFVISKKDEEYVVSIVKINDAMTYTMIAASGIALLTGNSAMLFNLIDLLQQLSYVRFMQYQFPSHLSQFLDSYTKISLKPILDYLRLDELLTNLNGGKLPFQSNKSQLSNKKEDINKFYLMNAKSCYFSIITSFVTYIACSLITKMKKSNYFFKIIKKKSIKFRLLAKLYYIYHKIQQGCLDFKNQYFYSGLFQIYYTIMHQFIFSAFMQFPDYNFTTIFEIFNSINAITGLGFIIFLNFQLFKLTTGKIKNINSWKFFFKDVEEKFWCQIFKPIQMLKITSYIFAIVFFMDYPQAQSFILSAQSSFYVVYLLQFKPIKFGFEYIKLISREVLFIITICSFYVYSYKLENEKMLLFGWFHISMFSIILGSNLILDIFKHIQGVYENIQQKKLRMEKNLKCQYQMNSLHKFIMVEFN